MAAGAGGNHGTGRNRSGESKTADCGKRSPPKSGMNCSQTRKRSEDFESQEGIRQTAAAESRFAGMLTPEEEKLMREIISEYV